jgi:4-diphosphocytidyl-2-C-methyl-D-erythritol kinase
MEKGKITNMDLNISLVKQIPIAAGLAGGSTDAAGVLSALQSLFGSFKKEELLDLARSLGADVPFCLMQGCARARGIGEELTKLPSLSPEYFFVIAKGGEGVSTKDAYQLADSYPQKKSAQAMEEALCRGEADVVLQGFYNAFERAVLPIRPMAALAKEVMFREGAIAALMSGSGPSVFGIFVDQEKAEKVRHSLSLQGYQAFVASPIL